MTVDKRSIFLLFIQPELRISIIAQLAELVNVIFEREQEILSRINKFHCSDCLSIFEHEIQVKVIRIKALVT